MIGHCSRAAAGLLALAPILCAQSQFAPARKQMFPVTLDLTEALAAGDIDGDGDVDLVVAKGANERNLIFVNDGSGVFTEDSISRLLIPWPHSHRNTSDVALGDIDGDGDVDVVFLSASVQLLLNDGAGVFTEPTAARLPTSASGEAVAFGDVDRDGDLDLVLAAPFGPHLLFLNDGTGTFADATAARMPSTGGRTPDVAFGDVDRDGDLDLVFGNRLLYLNDGTGTFTDVTAGRMPTIPASTHGVGLGDIDGDGDLDAVFVSPLPAAWPTQTLLFLNDGSGAFGDATAARLPVDNDDTSAVAVGDLDGDGDLDLVLANEWAPNRLYLNDGTGRFADATAGRLAQHRDTTLAVLLADLDGDRDLDLVFGNAYYQADRCYLNDGAATFAEASAMDMPFDNDRTTSIALGDVDGDGDVDAVLGNYDVPPRLLVNDGRGGYTRAADGRLPAFADRSYVLALADVDGDGDLDLLAGNSFDQNRLYRNDGAGGFADRTATRMPRDRDDARCFAVGDVDGDGDFDFVCANARPGGPNRLYINDGTGVFAFSTGLPGGVYSSCVALGDVDGDRDLDLIVDETLAPARLYLNDGAGRFSVASVALLPGDNTGTGGMAFGDVDGDGDLDLAISRSSGAFETRLYLNNGAGAFTDVSPARMPGGDDYAARIQLGDIDDDGDLDMVLAGTRLYLNTGGGFFVDATVPRMDAVAEGAWSFALGDVDGDGDLDLFHGRQDQNVLYVNLLRHVDAPLLLRAGHSYPIDVYARYGPAGVQQVGIPLVSLVPASFPLGPFGNLGVDPGFAIPLPALTIPQLTGVARTTLSIPASSTVIGTPLFTQALIVPAPLQARLTNVEADVLVR